MTTKKEKHLADLRELIILNLGLTFGSGSLTMTIIAAHDKFLKEQLYVSGGLATLAGIAAVYVSHRIYTIARGNYGARNNSEPEDHPITDVPNNVTYLPFVREKDTDGP